MKIEEKSLIWNNGSNLTIIRKYSDKPVTTEEAFNLATFSVFIPDGSIKSFGVPFSGCGLKDMFLYLLERDDLEYIEEIPYEFFENRLKKAMDDYSYGYIRTILKQFSEKGLLEDDDYTMLISKLYFKDVLIRPVIDKVANIDESPLVHVKPISRLVVARNGEKPVGYVWCGREAEEYIRDGEEDEFIDAFLDLYSDIARANYYKYDILDYKKENGNWFCADTDISYYRSLEEAESDIKRTISNPVDDFSKEDYKQAKSSLKEDVISYIESC